VSPVWGWSVERPDGSTILTVTDGKRGDALAAAFDPAYAMPVVVYHRLQRMNDRVAGWAPIACNGWRVYPVERPK
jgi:hypothetical protein